MDTESNTDSQNADKTEDDKIDTDLLHAIESGNTADIRFLRAKRATESVLRAFQKMGRDLQGDSESSRISYELTLSQLQRVVSPNAGYPASEFQETILKTITQTLTDTLHWYPSHAGRLFARYEPIFNTSDRRKAGTYESNLNSFVEKEEPIIVLARDLARAGKPVPQTYPQLHQLAIRTGKIRPI